MNQGKFKASEALRRKAVSLMVPRNSMGIPWWGVAKW